MSQIAALQIEILAASPHRLGQQKVQTQHLWIQCLFHAVHGHFPRMQPVAA